MGVIGVGIDIVEVGRFGRALIKAPKLRERLFVESERGLPIESLAARFAAKEAVAKVLGGPHDFSWHDILVHKSESGAPSLVVNGRAGEIAAASGINRWHISLTHDGGLAMAFVVAEN